MLSLVYVSAATRPLDEGELAELLEQCRRNNARLGVTGMLLYRDGDFIQALEGEEAVVRELFARISLDPRHHTILKLLERETDERSFGEWTMGFRTLRRADLLEVPGFTDFLDRRLTEKPVVSGSLARRLLQSFLQGSQ